jgi:hypothetical protein
VSIGEVLAEARHRADLTVGQVSQQTRIRESIIRGIEDDDYSASGGDFYARGQIRSIAKVVGTDPGPLIREYDTAYRAPGALSAVSMDELVTPPPAARRRQLNPITMLALLLVVVVALGLAAYSFLSGSRHTATAGSVTGSHAVTHHRAGRGGTHPAPKASPSPEHSAAASQPATVPAQTLTPVSAKAFSPYGGGQGDNPRHAPLAIDASPRTAWHTDWYTTARFGNLYPGTGLLLDMGRPVTIAAARIALGHAQGASLELRVGSRPALSHLPPVARAAGASGVVNLRLTTAAHGRYVLIWFTRLPADPAGTFQASVYDVRLKGEK